MHTFHVKKNDEVVVIAGADRGKRGRVISVSGKKQRVIIEGVRMTKKHQRKSQAHPQGAIIEREGPRISMLVPRSTAPPPPRSRNPL